MSGYSFPHYYTSSEFEPEASRYSICDKDPLFLFAFDFDNTLIEANSDLFIQRTFNIKPRMEKMKISFENRGTNIMVHELFRFLYPNTVLQDEYDNALGSIPLVENMTECIYRLKHLGGELIVISDGNTYFIKSCLEYNGVLPFFSKVFANPANFDNNGNLVISPYHVNLECKLSSSNLCKGRVLMEYVQQRVEEGANFLFVAFAGDGYNDFCPMARLHRGDVALPRKDHYICQFIAEKAEYDGIVLRSKVAYWSEGKGIVSAMRRRLRECHIY